MNAPISLDQINAQLAPYLPLATGAMALFILLALLVLLASGRRDRPLTEDLQHLRILAEQALADGRSTRLGMEQRLGELTTRLVREQGDGRVLLEVKLREMSDQQAHRLGLIEKSVNEHLHQAVEKQMQTSFQRVIDQFTAVQKAMADVQAVTAQIGDLRRVFANVKSRGGWGETQLRALLDDILPDGYLTNARLRDGSAEVVEFAIRMPMRGDRQPLLAVDAKFPLSDYERLLDASAAQDAPAERAARRALETALRLEARKIADKYIVPPTTVEFAVMYLPTDSLYAEAARMPGLIDDLGRGLRVMVMGPALLPALLRTIQLGYVTLALEQKADQIVQLLAATKQEMLTMDAVLERLSKNAGTMSRTIDEARRRTRVVARKLREVETLGQERAPELGLAESMLSEPEFLLPDLEPEALA